MPPPPNQLSRLSARSVYCRNAPKTQQDKAQEKRRPGRPRKHPLQKETKVLEKTKNRVLAKKSKKRVAVKRGRPKMNEENSSEADCSSSENSSESDSNATDLSEEVIEKNGNKRKNKSANSKEIDDEDSVSEDEIEGRNIIKEKRNKKKQKPVTVGEVDEDEVEEEEDNDDGDEEEDNVLYSFAERKTTTPVKKKRKLMVEKKKSDSVTKRSKETDEDSSIESNHQNPSRSKKTQHNKSGKSTIRFERENSINGDGSPNISANEVDMDDDLSLNSISLGNGNNRFPSSLNTQANRLSELLDSSTSKSKISSYVERNRTAKCGNFAAQEAFQWMISPINHKVFFEVIFERQPYHIARENAAYYHGLFTCNDLETMIKENNLVYGDHLDVVKYENFRRVCTPIKGKAISSNIWDDYKEGFSVRVRNPQHYNKNLWNFCALLQEYFSSVVGVNVYLTPPNSQGFPPHYDDIDALIVQTNGTKKWKIYSPRNPKENLARYPSKDFTQEEVGTPVMEITLNTGDFLYIPRGYIHQAETQEDDYSLHLTFSTNQLNTWGDLLLESLEKAMDHAILNETDMRRSLPKDYTDYVGTAVSNMNFSPQRTNFIKEFYRLAKRSLTYLSADEGADIHALKSVNTSLPPVLNKLEKSHSIHGNGSHWKDGGVKQICYPKLNAKVQLLRRRNIRLVVEDRVGKVYHTFENERDPRPLPGGSEDISLSYVEIHLEEIPAFVFLLKHSPNFVSVQNLPFSKKSEKLSFVRTLYESGLLMTEEPLELKKDDQSSFTSHER